MLRLPIDESTTYPELVIYKSKESSPKFSKLLSTLKHVALSYGNTVTIRVFGQAIQAKDLGYMPKAAKEEDQKQEMGESRELFLSGLYDKMKEIYEDVTPFPLDRVKNNDTDIGHIFRKYKNGEMEYVMPMAKCQAKRWIDERQGIASRNSFDYVWIPARVPPEKRHGEVSDRLIKERPFKKVAESYERSGTTRSSYHINPKVKKARVIIRHSKAIDETAFAARSKNVKSLFVENFDGERRKVNSKSLMAARALANHVNHGGGLYDSVANNILMLSEDLRSLKSLKRKYPVSEDEDNKKLHNALGSISEGLTNLMKGLNTSKIYELAEHLTINPPNLAFSSTFYKDRLGEEYSSFAESLGRGSIIYSKMKKLRK